MTENTGIVLARNSQIQALSRESQEALARYGIVHDASAIATLQANLGGAEIDMFSFDTITLPLGGGTRWQIDTLSGVETPAEITGIISWWTERRRYYEQPYSGEGSPPDCSSVDLIHGRGNPGGLCAECPLNAWGSAIGPDGEPSAGKACGQYRLLFFNRGNGAILPDVVAVPPTSLGNSRKYFFGLVKENLPHYAVVTTIRLEKGKPVSKMIFTMKEVLPLDVVPVMADYAARLRAALGKAEVATLQE